MQEANISSETLDQFQSAFETTLENLDDDDKLMLTYVIDRRISETPFPGWVLFKSRLTTVEAHILSHALKDKGYDNRIRRDRSPPRMRCIRLRAERFGFGLGISR